MVSAYPQSKVGQVRRSAIDQVPISASVVPRTQADVLAGNVMGITGSASSPEEKLMRFAALVPMALEVVDEARDTIRRLREQVEALQAENTKLRGGHA